MVSRAGGQTKVFVSVFLILEFNSFDLSWGNFPLSLLLLVKSHNCSSLYGTATQSISGCTSPLRDLLKVSSFLTTWLPSLVVSLSLVYYYLWRIVSRRNCCLPTQLWLLSMNPCCGRRILLGVRAIIGLVHVPWIKTCTLYRWLV